VTERPRRDSRREQRRAVDVNATIAINGRNVVVRTRDISRSGVCLISNTEIARETELDIRLVLSLGSDSMSEPLLVAGRSVWCTSLFGKYQVGVMFVAVTAEQARFLDLFMRFIDGDVNPAGHDLGVDDPERPEPAEDKDDPFRP